MLWFFLSYIRDQLKFWVIKIIIIESSGFKIDLRKFFQNVCVPWSSEKSPRKEEFIDEKEGAAPGVHELQPTFSFFNLLCVRSVNSPM